jgi:uncharacterized protein
MFEWEPAKAASNLAKLGVSFEEASAVFSDDFALTYEDAPHSDWELHFVTIGVSRSSRVRLVVNTERGDHTRITSARMANNSERNLHESQF